MKNEKKLTNSENHPKAQGKEKPVSKSIQIMAIQNGDVEFVQKNLDAIKASLFSASKKLSENTTRNVKYYFILVLSEIVQACTENGMGKPEAEEMRDNYIIEADKCRKKEEICKIYIDMCLDFTQRMQEIKAKDIISWHIRKCIDYINENLNCNLSIKTLAKLVGLNPSYLSRLFKQETGGSIKQFVVLARIQQAEELLKNTDLSYYDISVQLGFSSQSAFIAVFKKIKGVTPKRYRMQKSNNASDNQD
ncbi:MAG: AraC family transcriptional regulator [Oscillospiraceae bacterium]|nr:AraC family transcriptional regulator [Oscillospiraceae bacterium]